MFEQLEDAIKRGLKGKYIHIDPLRALEGLDAVQASTIPEKGIHSCWQLLNHIVYWQDLMLSALREEPVNWPKDNAASWPESNSLNDEESWNELVSKFKAGLEDAERLTAKIQSLIDLPAWPNVPPFAAFMVLVQHNAYHLGEIVGTRQALGFWPPPEYKPMF